MKTKNNLKMYFNCISPTGSSIFTSVYYVPLNSWGLAPYTLHFKECSIQIFAVEQIFIRAEGGFNIYNEKFILVFISEDNRAS